MRERLGLRLNAVSVVYERAGLHIRALDRLSLEVRPGEYVVVIGPNGAGKTSLINVVAGSVTPLTGSVFLGEREVTSLPDFERARWIARVFQDPNVGTCAGMTVMEHVALFLSRGTRRSLVRPALRRESIERFRAGVAEFGRGLEHRIADDVARLSGGERQLLSVLVAVASEPSILLLDEHTSALDPDVGHLVMEQTDRLVRSSGLTAVMVTHNMRQAVRYGDRLLILNRGSIVDDLVGAEKDALTESGLIERFREIASGDLTDRLLA